MRKGCAASWALALGLVLGSSAEVRAGGYDSTMLNSARYIGLAGAGVAFTDDPVALMLNPAGLMGVERYQAFLDLAFVTGNIRASPGNPDSFGEAGLNITSEQAYAPIFFVGLGARITDWLSAGLAVYPVGSGGAEFRFTDDDGNLNTDATQLLFLEISPGLSFQIPSYPKLSFGVGYRITYVTLDRFQETESDTGTATTIDFNSSGWSFAGLRVGAQWRAYDWLQLGITYRHKTVTEVEGSGTVVLTPWDYVATRFTLPSRLSFGVRSDIKDVGIVFDADYGFQSQNDTSPVLIGSSREMSSTLNNVSGWTDAWTLRFGLEYRFLNGRLPIRAGYVWDQQTTNEVYPSAFGTPPNTTHMASVGFGYTWEAGVTLDVAYAYRVGAAKVSEEAVARQASELGPCDFCGYPGDYLARLHAIYVSALWSWPPPGSAEPEPQPSGEDPEREAPTEAEPATNAETETETEPEPVAEPATETATATETETETAAETETETATATATATETETATEPTTQAEAAETQ